MLFDSLFKNQLIWLVIQLYLFNSIGNLKIN